MADSKYPVKYVAFLDILGFRELIDDLNKDETRLSFVRNLLRNVHNPSPEMLKDIWKGKLPDADLRAQSISDAVAISAKMTPDGLAFMFIVIERLANKLLQAGFFLRGAIAKGKIFHDHEMVFGEGLVRAYHFESKIAYPRIMLPREIADDVDQYLKKGQFKGVFEGQVRLSKDGPLYLHVLRFTASIKEMTSDNPERPRRLAAITSIRDHIQRRLNAAVDEPSHFEKVHWFADYWNEVFYGVHNLKQIEGSGLEILIGLDNF